MKYNVTEIEFDFDDDYANGFDLTFDEEIELRDLTLGVWEADSEDDLIEGIEAQIYDVKEQDLVRVMDILKAQAKQPKAEW